MNSGASTFFGTNTNLADRTRSKQMYMFLYMARDELQKLALPIDLRAWLTPITAAILSLV